MLSPARATRVVIVAAVVALTAAGCTRSEPSSTGSESSSTTAAPAAPAKSADFGTVTDVCQSGKGGGATAIGVTPDSIHIATVADPGNAARPGLDQEFFDTAKVFSAVVQRPGWDQRPQDRDRRA